MCPQSVPAHLVLMLCAPPVVFLVNSFVLCDTLLSPCRGVSFTGTRSLVLPVGDRGAEGPKKQFPCTLKWLPVRGSAPAIATRRGTIGLSSCVVAVLQAARKLICSDLPPVFSPGIMRLSPRFELTFTHFCSGASTVARIAAGIFGDNNPRFSSAALSSRAVFSRQHHSTTGPA